MYNDSVFLSGNLQAQRLSTIKDNSIKHEFVRKHFIYTCLLSENVYLPAANFFQSLISEKIVDEFALLFRPTDRYPQLAHIGINPEKENFKGEALEKSQTYMDISDYTCYKDETTRERLVNKLNSITEPYMRQGKLVNSLNDYILKETKEEGFLHSAVSKLGYTQVETQNILQPLVLAVEKNEKAIIPEYITQFDTNNVLNEVTKNLIKFSLLKAYSVSLESNYNAYVCNPLVQTYNIKYIFPYSVNYLDTLIFDMFLGMFDEVYNSIGRINAEGLRKLKYSERFGIFLNGYKKFVNELHVKLTSIADIRQLIFNEKKRQDGIYQEMLQGIANDANVASLIYKSMFGIKASLNKFFSKKIIKTDSICVVDENVFIYALVNEVYETFLKKYYDFLLNAVKSSSWQKKERKEGIHMFNKSINNIGGTQTIVEKSKGINVDNLAQGNVITFEESDVEQLKNFAETVANYTGGELQVSEKVRLSSVLFQLGENANDPKIYSEKIKEFHSVLNGLKDTAQKVVVSMASSILSKLLLTKLGLG